MQGLGMGVTKQKKKKVKVCLKNILEIEVVRFQWTDSYSPKQVMVQFSELLDEADWSSTYSITSGYSASCSNNDLLLMRLPSKMTARLLKVSLFDFCHADGINFIELLIYTQDV